MRTATGQVTVLTALVVVLAVLNVVQLAMSPGSAVADPGSATSKVRDLSKYRGGERSATTDAVKEVNETLKQVLAEMKGLRGDLTAGKLAVRIAKPAE